MTCIVIQTALSLEQDAVLKKMNATEEYIHPETKTRYKIGYYHSNGERLKVIVGRTNQTNINAGIETERIISHFKPNYIFFVGVAGGLKDVSIGDIVVGTDVIGYERGKASDQFLLRPQFGFSSYELEQGSNSFIASQEWKKVASEIVNKKFHDEIRVLSGTIASGEKVVSSSSAPLYLFLKLHCSHALAVEMESLGFLETCRHYSHIKSLIIRGISDTIEGKELADKEGSQPYAAANAVSFLFGLIDYLNIKESTRSLTIRSKISEIATKLYPAGLRDNEIWKRAGGDLSLVNLNTSGKAQWVQALVLVENGGGGDIDFKSLVEKMKADFPNNHSLKVLNL